jgi:hypothetical protein
MTTELLTAAAQQRDHWGAQRCHLVAAIWRQQMRGARCRCAVQALVRGAQACQARGVGAGGDVCAARSPQQLRLGPK